MFAELKAVLTQWFHQSVVDRLTGEFQALHARVLDLEARVSKAEADLKGEKPNATEEG